MLTPDMCILFNIYVKLLKIAANLHVAYIQKREIFTIKVIIRN